MNRLSKAPTSRLWAAARYEPNVAWPEFATLPLEEWLEATSLALPASGAPPEPPREVVAATSRQYRELYRLVTGEALAEL